MPVYLHFLEEGGEICRNERPGGDGIEITVSALFRAEGDMDIEAGELWVHVTFPRGKYHPCPRRGESVNDELDWISAFAGMRTGRKSLTF
jgi:hypothetical protein